MSSGELDPVKVAETLRQCRGTVTEAMLRDVAALYLRNVSTPAIGERFGRHHTTICSWLKKMGVELRPSGGRTVWTPLFISQVRELRAQGLSWAKVAKRAGVSHTTIKKAIQRGIL